MPAAVTAAPIAGVTMIVLPAVAAVAVAVAVVAAAAAVVAAGPEVGQCVENKAHGGDLGADGAGGREDEGVGR